MSESRPANRLARETSPYLRQHAHNPVDWFPWGPEAFAAARRDDRPLLLSVGYSACHWCHVMERESFEDDAIATLMNRLFVNVKVDREERPDVDQIYMQAVQALSGRGGWPMTVFLTPDGVPFYGGTYYPPVDRHGMPGFPRVLEAVAEAYRARRGDIAETGRQLLEHMRQSERLRGSATVLGPDVLTAAYQSIAGEYDERWGGTGGAPKFPQPMIWEFLLRYWRRTDQPRALEMARATMVRMARGGIYDQIGGGFHRYSVDGEWLVPHFEKMLYDNAQLASLYLHGWLATGDTELKRICQQTLDYLLREMRHPEGGFFSATDADSEGEEGKFFVWTPDELRQAVGDDALAQVAAVYWGVADGPNFEGASILHVPREPAEVAGALGLDEPALALKLGEAGRRMYEARRRRVPPGLDDKVLAGWNGLALIALAEAGRALGRDDYLDAAAANAAFLTGAMRPDGRLRRSWKDGSAPISGYLEDHAMVGLGLLACYEGRFERRWLDASASLAEDALRLFWDAGQACFFDTGADQEALVVRPRNLFDNAVPSGTSMAIEWLLRLAQHLGSERHRTIALTALRPLADLMAKYPSGLARYLGALDLHLGPVHEVALVWPGSAGLALDDAVAREVFGRFRPNQVVAGSAEGDPAAAGLPLLEGRRALAGRLTAYVCRDYVCDRPTADAAELRSQLEV